MITPSSMSLDERILAAVRSIGSSATDAGLRKAVECNNELLIPLAVQRLQRAGKLRVHTLGYYEVADEPAPPVDVGLVPPTIPTTSAGETMATDKHCPACEQDKDREKDFDKGMHRCKVCVENNTPIKRADKAEPAKPPKTKTKTKTKANGHAPAIADELVIPASGAITCRAVAGGFEISQGNDRVIASYEQLQALRDWSNAKLKKAAA